jgi:hypothetical protein
MSDRIGFPMRDEGGPNPPQEQRILDQTWFEEE